ncbi:MAG: hypothetical protein C0459_07385 [Chitinophaga sp.]|nr:hypothetical protein [Chitinophaga sp.]
MFKFNFQLKRISKKIWSKPSVYNKLFPFISSHTEKETASTNGRNTSYKPNYPLTKRRRPYRHPFI